MKTSIQFLSENLRLWFSSVASLLKEPLIPVLHHSTWRLRWFGIFILIGNPLFYYVWSSVLPQPYENIYIRGFLSILGLFYMVNISTIEASSKKLNYFYSFILFLQLPLFFIFMLFENFFNNIWFASCIAMLFIYYQGTDWRIATIGVLGAFLIVVVCHTLSDLIVILNSDAKIIIYVFIFAWICAIAFGATSANLVKQNLANTAFSFGVMAHEMRTPLAGMSLVSGLLRDNALKNQDEKALFMSQKLDLLIKTVNTHLNNQVANSRLLNIPTPNTIIFAHSMILSAVKEYPFKTVQEANAVSIELKNDFGFLGSEVFFKQIVNNLINNAFKAIAVKELAMHLASIRFIIDIETNHRKHLIGIIEIIDNGIGVQAKQAAHLLKPFFSTSKAVGHGLGLAFCKQVVNKSKGELHFKLEHTGGARIVVSLPAIHLGSGSIAPS